MLGYAAAYFSRGFLDDSGRQTAWVVGSVVGLALGPCARIRFGGFRGLGLFGLDRLAQRPREIRHPVDVGDATFVYPAEELTCMEGRDATRLERDFELSKLQLRWIPARRTHAMSRIFREMRALDCSKRRAFVSFLRSR